VYELDAVNGNSYWANAIKKEIDSLLQLGCFNFCAPDFKPSSDYQHCRLTMVFEVKPDGHQKAQLIAGGHIIDPRGVSSRSTVVKGVSVRLLNLIAHCDGLKTLCGDIGNAIITADCLEKVYAVASPEFGDSKDSIAILIKALYGLWSSSCAFRAHFANFLHQLGFFPTKYDQDVWMHLCEERNGYDYICTHVDDFKVVAKKPE
jgi:hypothetical protein